MPLFRILENCSSAGGCFDAGQRVELSYQDARGLLEEGFAEEIERSDETHEQPTREAAVATFESNASAKSPRTSRRVRA